MVDSTQNQESMLSSPLELLFSAYSSEQVIDLHPMTESYRDIQTRIHSFSQKEQDSIYWSIYKICTEKERVAFCAGLRAGFRLAEELRR